VLIDTMHWIVVFKNSLSVTQDAGSHWTEVGQSQGVPSAIDFATTDVGLGVLVSGSCTSSKSCSQRADLFRTQDGGHTWIPTSLPFI
jgi:photosystem II stability/assembly factor-like uncharacterized protein